MASRMVGKPTHTLAGSVTHRNGKCLHRPLSLFIISVRSPRPQRDPLPHKCIAHIIHARSLQSSHHSLIHSPPSLGCKLFLTLPIKALKQYPQQQRPLQQQHPETSSPISAHLSIPSTTPAPCSQKSPRPSSASQDHPDSECSHSGSPSH